MAVLVADEVSKSYGDTAALDGVSLSIESGEVFGLVGPNGAGKTTLVRALTGTAEVDGRVVGGVGIDRILFEERTAGQGDGGTDDECAANGWKLHGPRGGSRNGWMAK